MTKYFKGNGHVDTRFGKEPAPRKMQEEEKSDEAALGEKDGQYVELIHDDKDDEYIEYRHRVLVDLFRAWAKFAGRS